MAEASKRYLCLLYAWLVMVLGFAVRVQGDCGRPPAVENGAHDGTRATYVTNDRVRYWCEPGYSTEHSPIAVCMADGTWYLFDGQFVCTPGSCGAPPEPTNGGHDGLVYTFGSRVTYTCNPGYDLSGDTYSTCQADGSWSVRSTPRCAVWVCPHIYSPSHGSVRQSHDPCSYRCQTMTTCDECYEVSGSTTRQCQSDKTWSGQPASCTKIDCGRLRTPYYGSIDASNTKCEAVAVFRCNEFASFPQGTGLTSVCQSNGDWSSEVPDCYGPCTIPHSAISLLNKNVGDKILHDTTIPLRDFSCAVGYSKIGELDVVCSNGSWNAYPHCELGECLIPSFPYGHVNGYAADTKVPHGTTIAFKCQDRYSLTGYSRATCHTNTFDVQPPTCTPLSCSLPEIRHGEVEYTVAGRVPSGTSVAFTCDTGYEGDVKEGICDRGQWTELVDCQPASCSAFNHEITVQIINNCEKTDKGKYLHGCEVNIKCSGTLQVHTNCSFGVWAGILPKCAFTEDQNNIGSAIPKIVGGVLGGLIVCGCVILIVVFCYKKKKNDLNNVRSSHNAAGEMTVRIDRNSADASPMSAEKMPLNG